MIGEFPGKQPAGEGDKFPVVEVNYAEAEEFCKKLTEQGYKSGELQRGWEFGLPTEAQWEYAIGLVTSQKMRNCLFDNCFSSSPAVNGWGKGRSIRFSPVYRA